ncbi:uncharacterized protein E0L32_008435 [Thyridium curvatum]|uniref:Transcription initiation factor TFIID subunit 13 n=1 Tax=Thyridium curvatum TaxID=1093900 RepID=A0A507AZU6_9PEZI|nr:uncharacterized protein E0L32_008435 [Thyridium curvatum]TPX10549.1 hypothetical protein E0L32_008435 [Thyridium curvatum]
MEVRARAGKNVGKMNFGYGELTQLLYGSGDAREPLPESMRVLDEIATEFIQGLSFEAARAAHYAGRQKIKYEDFEFAMRRNPLFLGKVREMFESSKEIKDARKLPGLAEGGAGGAKGEFEGFEKLAEGEAGDGGPNGDAQSEGQKSGRGRKKKDRQAAAAEEELHEGDDDEEAEMDTMGRKR